ncbi:hypothetical protein FRAHR75_1900002 [Frankia sp. Hr75.2]|nr:hypothetical protein FRAHR75_1900002 [Frankia sp. Hr75.2]
MTSRLREAIATVSATFPLWQQAGDQAGLAAAYDTCAVFEYYNGRRRQAEAHAGRAAALSAGPELEQSHARAHTTRGYLAYMRGEVTLARRYLDGAIDAADRHGQAELAQRGRILRTSAALLAGDTGARTPLADDDEPLRRLAVLSALAERMWLTEVSDPRVTRAAAAIAETGTRAGTAGTAGGAGIAGTAWAAGDLAVWLARLGLLSQWPDEVAPPFRLSLAGDHDEAARGGAAPVSPSPRQWPCATPPTPANGHAAWSCWTSSAPPAPPTGSGRPCVATASPSFPGGPARAPGRTRRA